MELEEFLSIKNPTWISIKNKKYICVERPEILKEDPRYITKFNSICILHNEGDSTYVIMKKGNKKNNVMTLEEIKKAKFEEPKNKTKRKVLKNEISRKSWVD